MILAFWLFFRSRQKPKFLKLIRRKKPFWLLARCALNRSKAHRAECKPPRPVRRRGLMHDRLNVKKTDKASNLVCFSLPRVR